jgi:site-specific DNA-cytosine methylase
MSLTVIDFFCGAGGSSQGAAVVEAIAPESGREAA